MFKFSFQYIGQNIKIILVIYGFYRKLIGMKILILKSLKTIMKHF